MDEVYIIEDEDLLVVLDDNGDEEVNNPLLVFGEHNNNKNRNEIKVHTDTNEGTPLAIARCVALLANTVEINEPGGINYAKSIVDKILTKLHAMPRNSTVLVACLRALIRVISEKSELCPTVGHHFVTARSTQVRNYIANCALLPSILAMEASTITKKNGRRIFTEAMFLTWFCHDFIWDCNIDANQLMIKRVWPVILVKMTSSPMDWKDNDTESRFLWGETLIMAHDILQHLIKDIHTTLKKQLCSDCDLILSVQEQWDYNTSSPPRKRQKTGNMVIYDDSRDYDPTSSDESEYSSEGDDSKCFM